MEVYFLGTGAGVPSKNRNVSSSVLTFLQQKGISWMFDCGEATQQQILHTPIKLRKIEKIFITHLHGDHIFGLPGLLGSRSFQGADTRLTIYGPPGLKQFIEVALSVSTTYLIYPLEIVEVTEGVLFETADVVVECRKLEHVIPSYGFRISEKDRPGALDVEALKGRGVPPGPIYKRLKMGESVQLDNGTTINGTDFMGAGKKGRRVAILGDTRPCANSVELAENADVLIHEATHREGHAHLAHNYYHTTTVQAAEMAKQAQVSALLLTHISARYDNEQDELIAEARQVFAQTHLAQDHWKYSL